MASLEMSPYGGFSRNGEVHVKGLETEDHERQVEHGLVEGHNVPPPTPPHLDHQQQQQQLSPEQIEERRRDNLEIIEKRRREKEAAAYSSSLERDLKFRGELLERDLRNSHPLAQLIQKEEAKELKARNESRRKEAAAAEHAERIAQMLDEASRVAWAVNALQASEDAARRLIEREESKAFSGGYYKPQLADHDNTRHTTSGNTAAGEERRQLLRSLANPSPVRVRTTAASSSPPEISRLNDPDILLGVDHDDHPFRLLSALPSLPSAADQKSLMCPPNTILGGLQRLSEAKARNDVVADQKKLLAELMDKYVEKKANNSTSPNTRTDAAVPCGSNQHIVAIDSSLIDATSKAAAAGNKSSSIGFGGRSVGGSGPISVGNTSGSSQPRPATNGDAARGSLSFSPSALSAAALQDGGKSSRAAELAYGVLMDNLAVRNARQKAADGTLCSNRPILSKDLCDTLMASSSSPPRANNMRGGGGAAGAGRAAFEAAMAAHPRPLSAVLLSTDARKLNTSGLDVRDLITGSDHQRNSGQKRAVANTTEKKETPCKTAVVAASSNIISRPQRVIGSAGPLPKRGGGPGGVGHVNISAANPTNGTSSSSGVTDKNSLQQQLRHTQALARFVSDNARSVVSSHGGVPLPRPNAASDLNPATTPSHVITTAGHPALGALLNGGHTATPREAYSELTHGAAKGPLVGRMRPSALVSNSSQQMHGSAPNAGYSSGRSSPSASYAAAAPPVPLSIESLGERRVASPINKHLQSLYEAVARVEKLNKKQLSGSGTQRPAAASRSSSGSGNYSGRSGYCSQPALAGGRGRGSSGSSGGGFANTNTNKLLARPPPAARK